MSLIGWRLTGGVGSLSAREEAWNWDTFMWEMVCGDRNTETHSNCWRGVDKENIGRPSAPSYLVSKLLHVAGVGVALHDLELFLQCFFGKVLLQEQRKPA